MNYRNSISETIPSLETIFVDYLKADYLSQMRGNIPSNRRTIYYLLFEQSSTPVCSDKKTLLQHSVFKDSFISEIGNINLDDDSQYAEPLLYYVLHIDEAFPTNSKYSQFLSNLFQKNFSGKGQPPQVRYILNAIDFSKMSHRIDMCIQKQKKDMPTITQELTSYAKKILVMEPKLSEISGITGHETLSDCLTWILLFALFDESSFQTFCSQKSKESHLQNNISSATYGDDSGSISYNATLSKQCKKVRNCYNVSTYALLVLTVIQMVCFIVPFFCSGVWDISQPSFMLFCIIMLIISVALLILRYIPYYFAKETAQYTIALEYNEDILNIKNPRTYIQFKNTTTHNLNRDKYLRIFFFVLLFLWVLSVIISIQLNSLPVMLAGILISFVIFLYLDHYYNQIRNELDYLSIADSSKTYKRNKPIHGLALQYAWDYDIEKNTFIHKTASDLPNHSSECIRYILAALINRHEYLWVSYTIFSIILNCIALIIGIIQFMLPFNSYFRIPSSETFSTFCLAWIFINDIIYIVLLLRTENHYNLITRLQLYCSLPSSSSLSLVKIFHQFYNCGILMNIDIGHGIFYYHCRTNDLNIPVTSVQPIDDRMIVIHRYYDKIERVTLSTIALCLAFICIIVWHCKILAGLWCIPVTLICYPLFTFVFLPWIDRKFVAWCIKKHLRTPH